MCPKVRIVLTALGISCVGMSSAYASAPQVLCYLWADQPSPTINVPYTPDPTYSFNSKKKAVSVTKVATGVYDVVCTGEGGKGAGGHVQVSSYGSGLNTFCHVGFWDNGADLTAEVDCFGKGGGNGGGPAPQDSSFDFLYVR